MLSPFFFSSRRRHTRWPRDWSSDVCSSDLQSRLDGYRDLVPHPDLASEGADSPIYYHVDIGRVRLVVCDGRSARHIKTKPDDGTKSMLEIGRASCRERR